MWDIPLETLPSTLKVAMAAKIAFTWAATFTRLSLHYFYYRLVADSSKSWFKRLVYVNVAYTVSILISFTYAVHKTPVELGSDAEALTVERFLAIFMCKPVSDYWTVGSPPGTCFDEGVATLVCGIINCVADFATTVTPIPLVIGVSTCSPLKNTTLIIASLECPAVNDSASQCSSLSASS